MARSPLFAAAVLFVAAAPSLLAGPKPTNTRAEVVFADRLDVAVPARIRSDQGALEDLTDGAYQDGTDCVQAWYAARGNFFMRTVTSAAPCGPTVMLRSLVLDFTQRVWPSGCGAEQELVYDAAGRSLDVCGVTAIPDARLVADRLFSASATRLDIPFSLTADFRTTSFELTFVETLVVSAAGSGRTMTAPAGAIAELYALSGRTKTLLGRYRMPAQVTVTAAPTPF